jgi:hypothetical protein
VLRSLRASRSSSKLAEEEDQERLLRLGGDLHGGDRLCRDHLKDLLLGHLLAQLGDLTMKEHLGDLDLDGRVFFLLRGGSVASLIDLVQLFVGSALPLSTFDV